MSDAYATPPWPRSDAWPALRPEVPLRPFEGSALDMGPSPAAAPTHAAAGLGLGRRQRPAFPRGEADVEALREADLCRLHAVGFEMADGDTLVFVDVPALPGDPRRAADCRSIVWGPKVFRVASARLLATGSARFAEMLREPCQSRTRQRRKLARRLPPGVAYVVDLTPPSEGDELASQMTDLSLTAGVISWSASSRFHRVDPLLVSGHDDVCTCRRQPPAPPADDRGAPPADLLGGGRWPVEDGRSLEDMTGASAGGFGFGPDAACVPPSPDQLLRLKAAGDDGDAIYRAPPFRQMPDYCPIRHCNCIVRLMMLIQGHDVLLDSAARVWTLVALARIFDCTAVVRDKVLQWIMHGANAAFIEVLPEEALRLGFAIRSYQLTQCAFRILVNELALGEAAADTARRPPSRTTLFGRRRGECGDELDNAVQHAARALVDRLSATVARLESPTLFDEWAIRDWAKLRRLEPLLARGGTPRCEGALALLRRLMAALPAAVMAKLEAAARHPERDDEMLWSMDVDRASYVRPRDFERLRTVMAGFNLTQRLLCPFVYNELASACADPPPRRDPPVLGRARHVCLLAELETALQTVAACDLVPPYDDAWDEFLEAPTEAAGARRPKLPLVSLGGMDREVKDALRPLYLSWIRHDIDPPLNMTRHLLLTLTINELKFLPLWAGGLDDGTGGVFGRFVPPTDMGPSGPGPAYHTGRTLPQSATSSAPDTLAADDEFSVLSTEDGAAAASVRAAHGHASTAHGPEAGGGGFSSADDMASVLSDSFTANGTDYQDARIAVPAEHQAAPGPTNAAEEDDLEQRLAALDLESVLADDDFASDVENPFSDSSDSEDSVVVV